MAFTMYCGIVIFLAIMLPAIGQDIDECALGTHNCHVEARCINTFGGYDCQCKEWFAGDGYDCKGFCNESCSSIGECREGANGYTCFCRDEFCTSDDVPVIHDIQLLWRTHNSLFFGWTVSNALFVSSSIPSGAYGVAGKTQVAYIYLQPDTEYVMVLRVSNYPLSAEKNFTARTLPAPTYPVNPIVNTTDCGNCAINSICNSTEGGFTCKCTECFVGDGITCTRHCGDDPCFSLGVCYGDHTYRDLNITEQPTINNLRVTWTGSSGLSFAWDAANVVFSNAFLVGDDTSYEQHIAGTAGFSFLKPSTTYKLTVVGYNTIGNTSSASILAQTRPFVDEPTNSPATTSDVCGAGFQLIGSDCVDIDECSLGIHNCHERAVCTNKRGTFTCSCNFGYFGNGTICVGLCETSTYSLCGVGGYCDQNKYGTSCYCLYGVCPGDPALVVTNEIRGPDYITIAWKKVIPSYVDYTYILELYERDQLVAIYSRYHDKEATFGSLKSDTVYTLTFKPEYAPTNYSASYTFFTGTSTTAQTVLPTTDRPFTTPNPTSTTGPRDCEQNPSKGEYREAYNEWKNEFQKWQDCYRPCGP